MKKLQAVSMSFLISVMLLLSALPAEAGIVISCEDLGNGTFAINYDASSETTRIRSFVMNIHLSRGTIEAVSDYKIGESTAEDPGYGIFMSQIEIGPDGTVIDYGTPVLGPSDYPSGILPGLGSGGITVGMTSLYDGQEQNAPPVAGTLFKATVNFDSTNSTNVYIADNIFIGGITMEDGSLATPTYVGCTMTVPEPATLLLLGLGSLALKKSNRLA